MKISKDELHWISGYERKLLFYFAFYRTEWKVGDLIYLGSQHSHANATPGLLDRACLNLVDKGVLRIASDVPTVSSRRYALAKALDFAAARELLADGFRSGWVAKERDYYSIRASRKDVLLLLWSLMEGAGNFSVPKNTWYPDDALWDAFVRFADLVGDDGAVPNMDFPVGTGDHVFRILASIMFSKGLDVTPVLQSWHKRRSGAIWFQYDYDAIEYMALCVWTGRFDWLDVVTGRAASQDIRFFLSACIALKSGDIAAAARHTAFMDTFMGTGTRRNEAVVLSMPAAYLLSIFMMLFAKPVKTRLARLVSKLCPYNEKFRSNLPCSATGYFDERMENSLGFLGLTASADWICRRREEEWRSPACESGMLARALVSGLDRDKAEKSSHFALELAEKAFQHGCPTLAGLYLSVLGWTFGGADADAAERLAAQITERGGAWFKPYERTENPWKLVVEAFDKCLPGAGKAPKEEKAKAKSGRIVWALRFSAINLDDDEMGDDPEDIVPEGVYHCVQIKPSFRGPRGADDGSNDKEMTFKALTSDKYASIVGDVDREVLAALQKANPHGLSAPDASADALEPLCGEGLATRIHLCKDRRKNDLVREPITLEKRDLPLAVKSTEDGGLAISVAPWCLKVHGDYAIRMGEGEREFFFYRFPKSTLALMEVFSSFGKAGTITIPKDGVGAMRSLLPRMGALAPIQGELSAMGGGADLERVPGDATPLVRIEFEDEVLSLSLRVRPLSGLDLVFVPGAGQPERLVAQKGRSAVLVRDLAAEKAAADNVRAALDEFDSWCVEDGEWRIDSMLHALKALAALKGLGGAVRLEWRKGRRLSVVAPKPGGFKLSAVGGLDFWFSVSGDFQLDDGRRCSIAELIKAFRERNGEFVPFGDGAYLRLSSALVKRLEALESAGRVKGQAIEVPPAALPMLDGAFSDGDGDSQLSLPAPMEERISKIHEAFARKVDPPPRLKAELRPYQRVGYEWMSRLTSCGMGACLADDMGLGKTVQVIALLLERSHAGASLVVAPASVCGNWRSELARFAPTLRVFMAWDEKADAMDAVNAAGPGDVVVAGYGLIVSRERQFTAREWNGVVLDEAQAIKNEESKRAKAARRLKARFRVAATGTPVENRLSELWSISDFLNPGLLGSIGDFQRRFTSDGRATPALKRLVTPLIMRRVKRDVLDDLPEKTEITLPVILGDEERAGYETCRRMALDALAAGDANRISILAELTRLRRYCCHPSLVLGDAARSSAKMDALLELLASLRENRHRALVFSQFTDYLAIVRGEIDRQGWTHLYLDGQTPAAERERLVDSFQRGDGDFFLISLKAGGMGLNLTAANYVILLDPWWNPAVENQAADRVHRIGQKNPVTVYRLIASDTVEERVIDLHREKQAMVEDVLDGASSAALTPDQLMSLFR